METLRVVVEQINDMLWSYLIVALLLGGALYISVRSGFVQFRLFGEVFRSIIHAPKSQSTEVSSIQAFAISLASRVGTGNIAGVAIAISIGGAGAIFWMWVVALLGSASAFVESTLAQLYKRRSGEGYIGGPAYYIESGLRLPWLSVIFAILVVLTYGFCFTSVQSNTICGALEQSFDLDHTLVGIVLSLLTVAVVFGGVRRVARVSSVVVPTMAVGYIIIALVVVILNISHLPSVLAHIVGEAFGWNEAAGGIIGATLNAGVKRGLFSNEAGMGSAPNVAATATVPHPVNQGLIQMLGVFVDTLVICTATAFIILINQENIDTSANGVQITQQALTNEIGSIGGVFITIAIVLFAFSSIIGNYVCGEMNIRYISSRGWVLSLYRITVGAMVLLGAIATLNDTILYSDFMMGLMTLCNVFAILLLLRKALVVLKDYTTQRRNGVVNPTLHKENHPELRDQEGIECW